MRPQKKQDYFWSTCVAALHLLYTPIRTFFPSSVVLCASYQETYSGGGLRDLAALVYTMWNLEVYFPLSIQVLEKKYMAICKD
jgi:hypothetical protein